MKKVIKTLPPIQKKTKIMIDENILKIITMCFQLVDFCQKTETILTTPNKSDLNQKIYESLIAVFSSLGKNFETIANLAGYKLDLSSEKGKIILEKINTLTELDKSQRKKCLKELSRLLVNNK